MKNKEDIFSKLERINEIISNLRKDLQEQKDFYEAKIKMQNDEILRLKQETKELKELKDWRFDCE